MEKQVIISMSEYEDMKQTIQYQKQVIEIFEAGPNVVLIDERRSHYRRDINVRVPRIVSTDPEQAKEYLKSEFSLLENQVNEINRLLEAERRKTEGKKNRNSWF